jgi:hypothetical protein
MIKKQLCEDCLEEDWEILADETWYTPFSPMYLCESWRREHYYDDDRLFPFAENH